MLSHYTPTPSLRQVYEMLPEMYGEVIRIHEAKGNTVAVRFLKQQLKTIYEQQNNRVDQAHPVLYRRVNNIRFDNILRHL